MIFYQSVYANYSQKKMRNMALFFPSVKKSFAMYGYIILCQNVMHKNANTKLYDQYA